MEGHHMELLICVQSRGNRLEGHNNDLKRCVRRTVCTLGRLETQQRHSSNTDKSAKSINGVASAPETRYSLEHPIESKRRPPPESSSSHKCGPRYRPKIDLDYKPFFSLLTEFVHLKQVKSHRDFILDLAFEIWYTFIAKPYTHLFRAFLSLVENVFAFPLAHLTTNLT